MMNLISIFNARELAIIVWIVLALIWLSSQKSIRASFANILKLFFSKKLLIVNTLTLLNVSIVISLLYKIHLWNFGLLKDSLYWFLGTAIVLLFNSIGANREKQFFKNVILDSVKLIIVLEFIVNFYTFNFWIEFLLVPIFFTIGGLIAVSETDKKYQQVNHFLNLVTSIIGFSFLAFFFIKITMNYHSFFSLDSFQILVLPSILTLTFIPFLYLFALFVTYETLFLRLSFFIKDKALLKFVKHQILLKFNFNLTKLNKFSKNGTILLNQATDKKKVLEIFSECKS